MKASRTVLCSCRQRRDELVQEYLSQASIMSVGRELSSELYEYLTKR